MERNINNKSMLMENFFKYWPTKEWKKHGYYNDDYLQTIPTHWLQFQPESNLVYDLFTGFYIWIAIFGLIGNALVMFMILSCKSLKTPPNYLIFNLAVADFLILAKCPIFIINSLYRGPVMGNVGCQIYGFLGGLSGTSSIMSIAAIARDRYSVIAYPFNPERRLNSTKAIARNILIWIYAASFSSVPLIGLFGTNYTPEGLLTTCSFNYLNGQIENQIFILVFFCCVWAFPLVVIIHAYYNIWKVVRDAERTRVFLLGGNKNNTNQTDRQIALVAFGLVLLWFLEWTPYAIVALLGISGYTEFLTPLASAIPALVCKTGSCINPFIYFLTHPKFKAAFNSKFRHTN